MLQGLISPVSLGSSWHKEALLGSVVYKVFSVFHYSVSMSVCIWFPPPLKHAEFRERNAWDQDEILFFIWKACSTKAFLSPSLPPYINMHDAGLVFPSQEEWEEGRKPHVAGTTTLSMTVGTPLIRGKQQPCEL